MTAGPSAPADGGSADAALEASPLDTHVRDGVSLRVADRGRGGRPLVFVHGWGCSHRFFAPQIRRFSDAHRVVAPDLRGHGASDAPHDPIGVATLAEDLTWLCTRLSLERPLLVGHSLGGAVALEAAARLPEVAGLCLLDPALLFAEAARPGMQRMAERLTLASWRDAVRSWATRVFFLEGGPPPRPEWIELLLATPRRVLHPTYRDMLAFDPLPALARLRAPVLLIDPPRPVGDRTLLRRALPGLREHPIAGVGHFLQLEAPDRVGDALADFVAACP